MSDYTLGRPIHRRRFNGRIKLTQISRRAFQACGTAGTLSACSIARDSPQKHEVIAVGDTGEGESDALFAADQFLLQDGDVVLATQAASLTTQRILGLFGGLFGVGRSVSNLG